MSAMRRDIGVAALGEARLWLGTPYRHQASLRGIGCDCLGLLRGVWRGLYGAEPEAAPPYSGAWAESAAPGTDPLTEAASRHLVPVAGALATGAGDVLLFAFRRHLPARHCAIATGDGAMIHAHDGAVVTEVALTAWWLRHLTGVFRFPEGGSGPVHEDPVATVSVTPQTSKTLRTVSKRRFEPGVRAL